LPSSPGVFGCEESIGKNYYESHKRSFRNEFPLYPEFGTDHGHRKRPGHGVGGNAMTVKVIGAKPKLENGANINE